MGMLQVYPPYKNLVPRFPKEKEGRNTGLKIFSNHTVLFLKRFISSIAKVNTSYTRGKREQLWKRLIFLKIEYLIGNSWE